MVAVARDVSKWWSRHATAKKMARHVKKTYIPGKDDENRANGDFANEALETLLSLAVGVLEDLVADLEEVLGALHGGGDLDAGVGDGASHLDGELLGKVILQVEEKLECGLDDLLAVCERRLAPRLESLGGGVGKLI